MNTLQLVTIKARFDAYGGQSFDIVETATGFTVRAGVGRYEVAREIAERIDATLLYERDHGDDSLQTV